MKTEKDLLPFLKTWYHWATHGARKTKFPIFGRPVFRRNAGLCHSAEVFPHNDTFYQDGKALELLKTMFIRDGLDGNYPFTTMDEYNDEGSNETVHLNPRRLSWVKSTIERLSL